jgi:PKD repeat protein
MKRLSFLMGITLLFSGALLFNSCSDDPIIPTLNFIAEPVGYVVAITVESTDASTWVWNYGDGTSSTAPGSHSYTYKQSGTYTITGTVTSGDGNTAIKTVNVTIAASMEEILSGGPSATNGKTWIMNVNAVAGKDGGGIVANDVPIHPQFSLVPDNVLALFGLGAEYGDEFTFKSDGTYKIDLKNGRALAGIVYGTIIDPNVIPSDNWGSLPLSAATYTVPAGGTWSIDKTDYTVNVFNEFTGATEPEDVKFTFPENDTKKKGRLKLSNGQYFGVLDLFANQHPALVIIKEITSDKVHVAIGMNSYPDHADKPSMLLHITMVPKK